MFIAKFNVAENYPFVADKNGNYPLVGTVIAGSAKSAIVNGTIAHREGIEPNKLYLCDNEEVELEGGRKVWNTNVVSAISVTELITLKKELGAGRLMRGDVVANAAPIANQDEVF